MVKTKLAEVVGHDNAKDIWEYTLEQNARFKAMRKAVDEERGVIRAGMEIPDFETQPVLTSPQANTNNNNNKMAEPIRVEDDDKAGWSIKGWWSEPESRFKKPGDST